MGSENGDTLRPPQLASETFQRARRLLITAQTSIDKADELISALPWSESGAHIQELASASRNMRTIIVALLEQLNGANEPTSRHPPSHPRGRLGNAVNSPNR